MKKMKPVAVVATFVVLVVTVGLCTVVLPSKSLIEFSETYFGLKPEGLVSRYEWVLGALAIFGISAYFISRLLIYVGSKIANAIRIFRAPVKCDQYPPRRGLTFAPSLMNRR